MSFLLWDSEDEEEDEEVEWTRYHEATHAAVARSFGYSAKARVNSDGGGITEVW